MSFMYILINALKKYKKESLIFPMDVKRATKEFVLKGDSVGKFIRERLVEHDGLEINLDSVWSNYKQWYKLYVSENKSCGSFESFKSDLEKFNINIENNVIKNYDIENNSQII